MIELALLRVCLLCIIPILISLDIIVIRRLLLVYEAAVQKAQWLRRVVDEAVVQKVQWLWPVVCEVVEFVYDHCQKTPIDADEQLLDAIQNDDRKRVRRLVRRGGRTALHIACNKGNHWMVVFLIDHCRVDMEAINSYGETPLLRAVKNGHIEVTKYLVSKGANINAPTFVGQTPLHVAAFYNDVDTVDYLLENGAAVDATDHEGVSALHFASTEAQESVLCSLINYGANLEATTAGHTPLHCAADNHHFDNVRYLVERGANSNATDSLGRTALHLASRPHHKYSKRKSNSAETVRFLVKECHLNVETTDSDGMTALHHAASNDDMFDICRFLVKECDANIEAKTVTRDTALTTASRAKQIRTAVFLTHCTSYSLPSLSSP